MAQQQQGHPIFDDITGGRLEEVQRRVRADAAVLDEREQLWGMTPLMRAGWKCKPAIALWLIEHRGQHDLDSTDFYGATALHFACVKGQLSIVQALARAGANPAALLQCGATPLIWAVGCNRVDIVAFLLQQPAVKVTIDAVTDCFSTALSIASGNGYLSIVQRLLDAGADPTIPAGPVSPLHRAMDHGYHDVAALLRTAMAEPDRARALHKARALLDTAHKIRHIRLGNDKEQQQQQPRQARARTRGETQRRAVAAAPAYLKGRVERGAVLPQVDMGMGGEDERRLRATAAFVLEGLPQELYVELLGCMLPCWADKGPEA